MESLSFGNMNFTRRGKSGTDSSRLPRHSIDILCHAAPSVSPTYGPVAILQSSPVSQTSPSGSVRFVFSGKRGARERAPQMRGLNTGSMRVGSGFTLLAEPAHSGKSGNAHGHQESRGGFHAGEKPLQAAEPFFDPFDGCCVGEPQITGSAEPFAGYQCHARLIEQQFRELRSVFSEGMPGRAIGEMLGDIGESIERAARHFAFHAWNRIQTLYDALPPPIVLRQHNGHRLHRTAHGFKRSILRDGSRVRR